MCWLSLVVAWLASEEVWCFEDACALDAASITAWFQGLLTKLDLWLLFELRFCSLLLPRILDLKHEKRIDLQFRRPMNWFVSIISPYNLRLSITREIQIYHTSWYDLVIWLSNYFWHVTLILISYHENHCLKENFLYCRQIYVFLLRSCGFS